MGYILAYINIIIIALAFSIKLDKKLDITMFFSIISISLIEYFVGIITNLTIANFIVLGFTIICFGYIVYKIIKTKNFKCITTQITTGFVFISVLYVITIILYRDRIVAHHNEFGFWGLITKNMFFDKTLPQAETSILHIGYTPIVGVWQFWFCDFFEVFKDGNMYIANFLLKSSIIVAITSMISDKSKLKVIITNILIILAIFTMCYSIFMRLYVDTILALLAIFALLFVLKIKELNKINIFILTITFTFLTLVKDAGILFVIIALGLLLYKGLKEKVNVKRLLLIILLLLLICITCKNLWNYYLQAQGLNNISADTKELTISNIVDIFTGKSETHRYYTISNYFNYLIYGKSFLLFNQQISAIELLAFVLIFMLAVAIIKKDKETIVLMITIIITNILFNILLLGIYLFIYAHWEAESLSAITRYVQVLNIINVCAMIYIAVEKCKFKKTLLIIMLLVVILGGDNIWIKAIAENNKNTKDAINSARKFTYIEKYRDILNKQDKIYLITENTIGLTENVNRETNLLSLKYQIAPFRVYMYDNKNVTEEEIIDKLSCGYTYVYVHDFNEETVARYSFLLDENEKMSISTMYKLKKENGKFVMNKVEI